MLISRTWTPGEVRTRSLEVFREEGLKALWFKALGEIFYRRMLLLECVLTDLPAPDAPRIDVGFHRLTASDVEAYVRFRPEAEARELRRRLEVGDCAFWAGRCDRMVGALWVSAGTGWIEYLQRHIPLKPGEGYLYEAYTHPDFRGCGIGPALNNFAYRALREEGFRRILLAVNLENGPARKAFCKNGERVFAKQGFVRLGPWRYDFTRKHRGGPCPGAPAPDSRYWDGVAEEVDGGLSYMDAFLGTLKRRAYVNLLDRWGAPRPAGAVLKTDLFEEAYGPDAFLDALAEESGAVVGMDLAPRMAARAHGSGNCGRAMLVAADVRQLPFQNQSFGLIVSPSTLDHFSRPSDLGMSLRELARILKQEGVLILTLDNRLNVLDPALRLVARLGGLPYYLGRSYSLRRMIAELEAAGFVVEDTTTLLQHPRFLGVGMTGLVNRLGWTPLRVLVHRLFREAERLEHTPLRSFTGCFVAARAAIPKGEAPDSP